MIVQIVDLEVHFVVAAISTHWRSAASRAASRFRFGLFPCAARRLQGVGSYSALPLYLLIASRLAQGKCATAQEEDRCDSTTTSTVTIAELIST